MHIDETAVATAHEAAHKAGAKSGATHVIIATYEFPCRQVNEHSDRGTRYCDQS